MHLKVVCCIIARTNSTRLPQKVLKQVSGRRLIDHIICRMKSVSNIDEVYVATSIHPDDRILCSIAKENNVKCFMGSELSVISRLLGIAYQEKADYIVRVTGDNIYTDPRLLELLIKQSKEKGVEYARVEGAPIGVSAEVIKVTALENCFKHIKPELSEYLMIYMFNPDIYKTLVIDVSDWVPPLTTLTVDTPEDMERTEFIESSLSDIKLISLCDIVNLSKKNTIPFFYFNKNANVKLPTGEFMTFEKFYERQLALVKRSHFKLSLSQKEYENV